MLEQIGANSMTEQEAIKILNSKLHLDCKVAEAMGELEAREMGIKALEEVQQYRELGTVEELKHLKELNEDCTIKHLTGECSYNETGCSGCIGREKIRKALEKQIAKKPIYKKGFFNAWRCPICDEVVGEFSNYCNSCGQKLWEKSKVLDWGNEDAE